MPTSRFVEWTSGAGLVLCALLSACAAPPAKDTPRASDRLGSAQPSEDDGVLDDERELLALVQAMADDYIGTLGEACLLGLRTPEASPRQRWQASYLLTRGTSAAVDIGASVNPDTALLDLLVLATLQRSAFERIWVPEEFADLDTSFAVERMRQGELELWEDAGVVLSEQQSQTLRTMIEQWIESYPNRRAVEGVRFKEFTETRMARGDDRRAQAIGLLRQVDDATRAIDDAVLLGERIMWYSSRLTYVIGHQAELTTYRAVDQPEIAELREQIEAFREYAERSTRQFEAVPELVRETVAEVEAATARQRAEALDHLAETVERERTALIRETFDRFAEERASFFAELDENAGTLQGILGELQATIRVSSDLANNLTGTVNAIDRVVNRFDPAAQDREPLEMMEVRDAAVAAGEAAERLTVALVRADELLERAEVSKSLADFDELTSGLVASVFWRAVVIVGLLVAGLAGLRFVPQRTKQVGSRGKLDSR